MASPADENVALDEDEHLPWPDAEKSANGGQPIVPRFSVGTPDFLGAPKPAADWLDAV